MFSKFLNIFAAKFFKDMVKQRIIEEASELFGRSGVKSITMDDLARHLGISKRTIYENFKDKEELLIACVDAFHEENFEMQQKAFLEANNVADAILVILQKNAGPEAQRQFNLINDIRKYYPQVFREHARFQIDQRRKMEQLIQRGINEGVFRDDLNPEIIALFFCRQGESVTHNDKDFDRFSLAEMFNNIGFTFMRGICTAKGIEIIDKYKKSKSSYQ